MNLVEEAHYRNLEFTTRRHFLRKCTSGLGALALGSLMSCDLTSSTKTPSISAKQLGPLDPFAPRNPHFAPKAKRIIYMHMAGSPSQLELFDYKPELHKLHDQECPQSILDEHKFAFIQGTPKMLEPQAQFSQHGQSGAYVSNLLPHFSQVADEVTFIKSMHTDQFNHAPAQLLLSTGSIRLGRPSMGSWITYGLGTENQDLPGFMVLVSGGKTPSSGKSAWGSGFLPSVYQGVQCRSVGDPVL
ncbi:MAG: DUF1501 domain-containing protein, partial [Cyclobacteriaceae bacterium]